MKQAIAGVSPSQVDEVTIMTVWPSLAATGAGRMIGQLCRLGGTDTALTIGKLFALLCIPLAIPLYFLTKSPWTGRRYRVTNRRIIIEKGVRGVEVTSVSLDAFDSIEVDVAPGQAWYAAGDLYFRKGPVEVFQLAGVSRPEAFRQVCLKAHLSFVGVNQVLQRVAAPA